MPPVLDLTFIQFNLRKFISVGMCFALVGLEAAPVFARNNDDYYGNTYSSNYGSRGGYSAGDFERQMQQSRARLQSFVGPSNLNFNSARYEAPKLNLTYQPTIRFQYSPQPKLSDVTTKPVVKLETAPSVQKPTFIQSVGSVVKGIGAGVVAVFKKIGDGIVNFAQSLFGLNKKPEAVVTAPPQGLNESFKNLVETAPGQLQTQNEKTTALGQTWEPGSTFKQEGNGLRLVEGTAFVSNFGGIVREGGDLPVRFVDDGGKVKPVGLDFDRLAVGTTMKIQAPVTIEGFGKLLGGDMTFKGPAKTPEGTTVGIFEFGGAQVQLDGALGETLGLSSPANLIRATFAVESAVMNLKSAEVQSKDKRLFVRESKPVIDLNQVEKKLTAVSSVLAEAQGQFTKADRDFSNGAVASRSLLTNLARATGQTDVAVFQEPSDLKSLRQEGQSLAALSSQITENMTAGNYQEVAEALPDLTARTEVFKARSETLAVQAEMTKGFFKEIRSLTTDLSAVNQVVDVGDLAGKPITIEAAAKGYEWFPAPEKKVFADRASHAQETLVTLVEAGAVDADRALDWALSLKIAKDKVLGAGPGKLSDRISVAAAHPQATLKEASSEAADFYVFNTLSAYAETSPKTMMAVGYVGLGATKLASALGTAAGVGLMVLFPVSSVSGFAAGYATNHGLQAAGVNDDLAGFMEIASGMLVGGRVATGKRVSTLETAWAARTGANQGIAPAVQKFKAGFKEIMQGTQRMAQSEAGHVLVAPPSARSQVSPASKTTNTLPREARNSSPDLGVPEAATKAPAVPQAQNLFKGLGDSRTSPWLNDGRVGVKAHIEEFRNGGSALLPKNSFEKYFRQGGTVGRKDGFFITTKQSMDKLLMETKGNNALIKKRLGIEADNLAWDGELVRVDVYNPLLHNARFPHGMELGANPKFRWGGLTSGGKPEVAIDPVKSGDFQILPVKRQ
jgi:cytochrome c556